MLPYDLNRLEVFRTVARLGSFSKAAEHLKQPKSRVSRNISALEKDLGVQLIYRTTRQFQMTQAGKDLYSKTARLLADLGDSLDQVRTDSEEVSGVIKITVPEDIGNELMGKLSFEFMAQYPKIRIVLYASNQLIDLVKESVDIAVRISKPKDSTMIQKRIGEVGGLFVASPEFVRTHGPFDRIDQLEKLPYLVFGTSDNDKISVRASNSRETRTLKVRNCFASSNFFALRSLAQLGAGVTMLPPFLAREPINSGKLVQVFKEWKTEGVPIRLLIPHQTEPPKRIRLFVDFLAVRLAQYL